MNPEEAAHLTQYQISDCVDYFLVFQFCNTFFASWCNLQFTLLTEVNGPFTVSGGAEGVALVETEAVCGWLLEFRVSRV